MAPERVQNLLERAVKSGSQAEIIAYPSGKHNAPSKISYKELFVRAKRNSDRIRHQPEYKQGSVIMIHLRDQLSAIVWFWSVLYAGSIPVMSTTLPTNTTQKIDHLGHLAKLLNQPVCLTSRGELDQFSDQTILKVIEVESLEPEESKSNCAIEFGIPADLQHTALLMLTSGSTSKPKAVCLNHRQILAAVKGKSAVVKLFKGTSFLNWIAMDHVASLIEIHLQALYLDMDQVHVPGPDLLTDPTYFIDLIDRHRVSRTFAPNFFLTKLRLELERSKRLNDWDLSCLQYIASGGEANVTETCVAVTKLLETHNAPSNVIIPGFGMTETCAGSIFNATCPAYDVDHGLSFASLGYCMPGIEMRIGESEQSMPAGTVGDVEVRGAVVFEEYFNDPAATAAAFVNGGWFKTGDRGMIDAAGCLHLTGRAKDVIIVNGAKHSPQDVETSIDEAKVPGVTPGCTVAFSSWSHSSTTEEIYVLYLPSYQTGNEDGAARLTASKAIQKEVVAITGARPIVIPVDETVLHRSSLGKFSRGQLKARFEKGDLRQFEQRNLEAMRSARAGLRQQPVNGEEETILKIFLNTLNICQDDFDVETPFFEAGTTSIELIQLKRKLEQTLKLDNLSITTLISYPTVRSLARELLQVKGKDTYQPVVTLQPEGDKTPLWLIHPGVGEVLVFVALAKYLTRRKLYALRARGFNNGESYFQNIEEAVNVYHQSIKQTQPLGPYAIAGYSYGTMLAFEVAKKLEAHGDRVAFCASFNLPPHIKTRMRQLDWNECLMHLGYFLGLFDEQHGCRLINESKKHGIDEHDTMLTNVVKDADGKRFAELSLTPTGLKNWASLAYSLQSMASDYDPTGSVESIDVFYCTPLAVVSASRQEWMEDHLSKWESFSRTHPRFHEVRGEHYTMLDPDNCFTFQQTLQKALKARGI